MPLKERYLFVVSLVLWHVNSCWVILWRTQFSNFGLQLMRYKIYLHNHFTQVKSLLS